MSRKRIKVRILEDFSFDLSLAPLTTTNVRTREEEVILPARTTTCSFKAGTTTTLGTQEAAEKFVERSGGKAVLADKADTWEVIVGNIGVVYRGFSKEKAWLEYSVYVAKAKHPTGRCSGESVDLWKNGEPVASTPSTLKSIEEEEEGVNGNWEVYP